MRAVLIGLMAGVLAVAPQGAALAQSAAPPPAGASAKPPSEATVKLVRRVMAAMHMERQMEATMNALMPVMMDQQVKLHPNITAEDQKMIMDLTHHIILETFFPKLMDRAVSIYASVYSDEELTAMASFYESPTGQSILAKTPQIAPKVAEVTRELLPEATAQMARELCAKLNCLQSPPAAAPKPRPS